METITTQETASNTNTPATEEIAQAQAILAKAESSHEPPDTIDNSVAVNADEAEDTITGTPTAEEVPEAQAEEPATEGDATVIDPVTAARILQLCNSAITSYFYMSNPKRVAALESALAIPVSDDKSFQQFYTHSEKDLLADAYRDARKNNGTPTEVTNALIMAEAHRRYFAKHQKRAIVNEEYEA